MKVKISYWIPEEKIIDITPKEYCHLRANPNYLPVYPEKAFHLDLEPLTDADEKELDDFILRKREGE